MKVAASWRTGFRLWKLEDLKKIEWKIFRLLNRDWSPRWMNAESEADLVEVG